MRSLPIHLVFVFAGLSLVVTGCGVRSVSSTSSPPQTTSASAAAAPNEALAEPLTTATTPSAPSSKKETAPRGDVTAEAPAAAPVKPAVAVEATSAAQAIQLIDLRKVDRLNPTRVLEEGPTYIYYSGKGSVAAADAFYREVLAAQGWKMIDNNSSPITKEYADRLYANGPFHLRVSIGASGDEGIVGIGLSNLGNLDMTTLPRTPDGEPYAGNTPVNANFRTEQGIADLVKWCRKELPALGWQEYTSIPSQESDVPHYKSVSFRKNAARMNVLITKNPQKISEKTMVTYMAENVMPFDVPAVAGAEKLGLDLYSGKAEYASAAPVAEVVQFYQTAGPKFQWKPRVADSHIGDAAATLMVEDQPELGFAISIFRRDDKTHVAFQRLSFKKSAPSEAEVAADKPMPKSEPTPNDIAATKPSVPATDDLDKNPAAAIEKEAKDMVRRELKKLGGDLEKIGGLDLGDLNLGDLGLGDQAKTKQGKSAAKTSTGSSSAKTAEKPAAAPEAPFKSDGKPSTVSGTIWFGDKKIALQHGLVFRKQDRDETVTIIFASSEPFQLAKLKRIAPDELSIFDVMGKGFPPAIEVRLKDSYSSLSCFVDGSSINFGSDKIKSDAKFVGERLKGKVHLPEPEDFFDKPFRFELLIDAERTPLTTPAPGTSPDLTANSDYSLPVPEGTTEVAQGRSPYRTTIDAKIKASLADVVKFYRAEAARREWNEDAKQTQADSSPAKLTFTSPEGTVAVTLRTEEESTTIQISTRNEALAKEHGIVPAPGESRFMLGNATDGEVVVLIDKKAHKLAAEVGAKDPSQAIKVNSSPGKHSITVQIAGQEPQTETIDLPADSVWGIIVLPTGGYFAEQVY